METLRNLVLHIWDIWAIREIILFAVLILLPLWIILKMRWIGLLLVLVVAGTVWQVKSCQGRRLHQRAEELGVNIQESLALQQLPATNVPPYVRGRIVAIDPQGQLSPLYLKLPNNLKAETRDQIGTVVIAKYWNDVVGQYGVAGKAIVRKCSIDIVDASDKVRIYSNVFRGSDPPSATSGGDASGSSPDWEVLKFLKNLPQKTTN